MITLIQPYGFYKQADSSDYHNCAVSMATGNGMYRIDNQQPIFWRTPGYPFFLSFFYRFFGIDKPTFDHNRNAQIASIWAQIIIASCIPIILFYLALLFTQIKGIALITAWIGVFHPGLILASTYLLTEGIALVFFYLFLLFIFKNLLLKKLNNNYSSIIAAALCLSIYTWIRPMGEFVGYATALLIFVGGNGPWKTTAKKALLFLGIFIASLMPWYWRNYQLTNEWFFCPTIGTYLNCFSVPKILRRTLNKPIIECHKIAQQHAGRTVYNHQRTLYGTGLYVSPAICKTVAFPIVLQHPFYFIYDWIHEVIKTTFDLYAYQIIPMLNNSYWYDPIEEWLPDKIRDCLYAFAMPWYLRCICWLELIGALLMWIGLLGGFWVFVVRKHEYYLFRIWLLSIPLIGIIVGMTGGFGYARLRLPAEPLFIILSLSFWFWFMQSRQLKRKNK
jgi:hypothetical protein